MNKQNSKLKTKNSKLLWGASYGELVWRQFCKSRLNVVCLIFVVLLFLLAVLAPFLANDKPLVIFVEGQLFFPLFKNLQPVDYCIFLAAIVGLSQLLLIRRNRKRVEPAMRGSVLCRQLSISCAIILAGIALVFVLIPRRLDATDYKSMAASVKAAAIFAPVPYGKTRTNLAARQQPPSRQHWLGTDDVGCDVLCRLVHGSRVSLAVGFMAVGISSIIGIAIGAILGYFGGKVDFIGMRAVEIVMAIPVFFLIITAVAFFPRSLANIAIIIGITSWTGNARFIRAEFLKLRRQDFVQAAVSLGLPLRSILFRHMLPNAIAPVLVNATFGISGAIFIEAALSFLGFGVAPPTPSWGQMLSLGVSTTGRFLWWLTLFPGLAIFLTVLAYNLLGEGLRDAFDPCTPILDTGYSMLVENRASRIEYQRSSESDLLSVRGLSVSFFTEEGVIRAVQNVSFSIRKGRTFALVGESGCGKTTVALAIMQLLDPGYWILDTRRASSIEGQIIFEGQNLLTLSEKQTCGEPVESMRQIRGNKIAMIFAEPETCLNPVYTVGDQIAEAIKIHRKKSAGHLASAPVAKAAPATGAGANWADAIELLAKVGIANAEQRAHQYPHQFSGGMQQRVMIAMAISCKPKLLIADEPTTALDVTTGAAILDLLDELQNQDGMSILLITHDLGVVAERADDIAVMYASRIVEVAESQQLFAAPFHPYTAGLLRCLPARLAPGPMPGAQPCPQVAGLKRLQTIPGAVPQPPHFPTGCKFHPRCRIGSSDNRCQTVEPELRQVQPGRWAACWHAPA